MNDLQSILTEPTVRPNVVADCLRVIDEEVQSKGGLTGIAIKGAYAVVKAVKPGFIAEAMNDLLPDFAARLDRFLQEARGGSQPVGALMRKRVGFAVPVGKRPYDHEPIGSDIEKAGEQA